VGRLGYSIIQSKGPLNGVLCMHCSSRLSLLLSAGIDPWVVSVNVDECIKELYREWVFEFQSRRKFEGSIDAIIIEVATSTPNVKRTVSWSTK
jgi:siroheme synthase (precorrin-2 oxidase/ferrochelatase)